MCTFIQLRCRAVSATVLIWMLVFRCSFFVFSVLGSKYVSKMVPQILKNAPQMGPKAPKFGPKSVKMDQKWVQNGQDGTQIAHPGAQLDFRRFSGRKTRPKWRPKWSKNRSTNHSKKRLFLEAGSDAIFVLCFTHVYFKMVPKWSQVGTKIDRKTVSGRKSGFSF